MELLSAMCSVEDRAKARLHLTRGSVELMSAMRSVEDRAKARLHLTGGSVELLSAMRFSGGQGQGKATLDRRVWTGWRLATGLQWQDRGPGHR